MRQFEHGFALLAEGGQLKLVYVYTGRHECRVFRRVGQRWAKRAAWVPRVNLYPLPPGISVTIPQPL